MARLYHDLARLLRLGGLFLNGENMAFGPALPTFARLSQRVLDEQWTDAAFAQHADDAADDADDADDGEQDRLREELHPDLALRRTKGATEAYAARRSRSMAQKRKLPDGWPPAPISERRSSTEMITRASIAATARPTGSPPGRPTPIPSSTSDDPSGSSLSSPCCDHRENPSNGWRDILRPRKPIRIRHGSRAPVGLTPVPFDLRVSCQLACA